MTRTPEVIFAQLQARMLEMEEQAKAKAKAELTACHKCRWCNGPWCEQPLVIGIEAKVTLHVDFGPDGKNSLCGDEKVLWEVALPKPTFWQRFLVWLLAPWKEST